MQKTSVGGTDYNLTHDPDHGFITGMPHLSVLQWNWKEEIVATSKQAYTAPDIPETTYYQYDSKGTRLRKITENYATSPASPTQKDQRIYIAGWEFYEDFGSSDTTETLSLIDASTPLSTSSGTRFVMIENSSASGLLTRYQHPNHQSSCTMETDENGDVITYEEYHPFGTTSYQAKNSTITASYKRYRYTGMERDDESGLSYHNARYYISWLGRWMNPDPIGINDGVNVYAYCGGNPVGSIDSTGTQTEEVKNIGLPDVNKYKLGDIYDEIKEGAYGKDISLRWYVSKDSQGKLIWEPGGIGANLDPVEVTTINPKLFRRAPLDVSKLTKIVNLTTTNCHELEEPCSCSYSRSYLGFGIVSLGGGGGFIIGGEGSFKFVRTDDNPYFLYRNRRFSTFELDLTAGEFGYGVAAEFGRGAFIMNIWTNPADVYDEAKNGDIGGEYGFVSAGYNGLDPNYNKYGSFSYGYVGIGIGAKAKGDLGTVLNSMRKHDAGAKFSYGWNWFMSKPDVPTIMDSVRTAFNNPDDSLAKKVIERFQRKPDIYRFIGGKKFSD